MRAISMPRPIEFTYEGRRFVQYGMSPVKMASMRASMRKAAKGTRKNPIIKDGKEYVYTTDGRLLRLEHHDWEAKKANTVISDKADIQKEIKQLEAMRDEPVGLDAECPELTDEQIAVFLQKTKDEKKTKG